MAFSLMPVSADEVLGQRCHFLGSAGGGCPEAGVGMGVFQRVRAHTPEVTVAQAGGKWASRLTS